MNPPGPPQSVPAAGLHQGEPTGATCPFMPTYAPPTVTFVEGSGCWLTDDRGRRYLDLLSGLAVTSLGHAHPDITAAVATQAATLVHVSNLFASPPAVGLAEAVNDLLGGGGQVFLCNSGAEANEAAIKLARRSGGEHRRTIVAAHGSFHGRTLGALAATGQPAKQAPFTPLPAGFIHVDYGDLTQLEASLTPDVCAVMIESVQGEGGVIPAPDGYLRGIRDLCDRHGVLFMVDEVQTGMGRTGAWFGFEHDGVRPDVVMLAKALGNGVPIGACWATTQAASHFSPGDHGTTYGGGPLVAAAALRTVEVLTRINAPALAARAGQRLAAMLSDLPGVTSVRGRGLLLACELTPGVDAPGVAAAALRAGVIVNAVTPTALRLAPPLVITDEELAHGVETLGAVLREATDRLSTTPETGDHP